MSLIDAIRKEQVRTGENMVLENLKNLHIEQEREHRCECKYCGADNKSDLDRTRKELEELRGKVRGILDNPEFGSVWEMKAALRAAVEKQANALSVY